MPTTKEIKPDPFRSVKFCFWLFSIFFIFPIGGIELPKRFFIDWKAIIIILTEKSVNWQLFLCQDAIFILLASILYLFMWLYFIRGLIPLIEYVRKFFR